MRTELYYTLYDAECAACAYAKDHNGLVVGMDVEMLPLRTVIDDRSHIDYTDRRFEKNIGLWSGETAAVRVIDKNTSQDIARFGYFEDEID